MMERVTGIGKLTPDEYLVWEEEQDENRHEYHDGDVFLMSEPTTRHEHLAGKVLTELDRALGDRCFGFVAKQRIQLDSGKRFVYPDVVVVCGPEKTWKGSKNYLTTATVLVEVLSPSTEGRDRGFKWEHYQRIASLTDYVLVSQQAVRIEHFRRETDRAWLYRAYGPGERVVLASAAELEVDTIYRRAFELSESDDE